MKQKITVFILFLATIFIFTACDSDNSSSGTNQPGQPTGCTLSIVYPDKTTTVQAVYGEEVVIPIGNYLEEQYISGYADADGNQFFNELGQSKAAWRDTYPTTFYPIWKSIYELKATSVTEETVACGHPGKEYWVSFDNVWKQAINSNLEGTLHFSYSCEIKNFYIDAHFTFYDSKTSKDGGIIHSATSIPRNVNDFRTITGEFDVSARKLKSGYYSYIIDGDSSWGGSYFRNLEITVTFVDNTTL